VSINWHGIQEVPQRSYTCGFCGVLSGSNKGWQEMSPPNLPPGMVPCLIYICTGCSYATFFNRAGNPTPGVAFGDEIHHLPQEIDGAYKEARACMSVQGYTAAALLCRKLLMNVAMHRGAPANQSFSEYVNYLETNHITPADSKSWVDHIRVIGNIATHEIRAVSREDAERLITFTAMLLKIAYEFPALLNPPTP
jgi:hypothetical protein